MAIGDQVVGDKSVPATALRDTYENFLRSAILAADATLEVTRADDVAAQGTITTDILTRLMHSDFVVVDITYPNPNVFYELGVRHACRPGTILVRDASNSTPAPFDLAHQRHIPYERSLAGMKALTENLMERFAWYSRNKRTPDNHLLEHAKSSKFNFPQYGAEVTQRQEEGLADMIDAVVTSEGLMTSLVDALATQTNAPPVVRVFLESIRKEPATAKRLIGGLVKLGVITPEKLFK